MKIVIFSDVHGNKEVVERIFSFNPDADYFFSLGDSELPKDYLESKQIIFIKGNYPFDPGIAYDYQMKLLDTSIFLTHGHKYSVRRDVGKLLYKAKELEANLVLYGHTHIANIEFYDGIYIVNPGSANRSRNHIDSSYLVLTIDKNNKLTFDFKNANTNENIELDY